MSDKQALNLLLKAFRKTCAESLMLAAESKVKFLPTDSKIFSIPALAFQMKRIPEQQSSDLLLGELQLSIK